jgi:hypothetical protein
LGVDGVEFAVQPGQFGGEEFAVGGRGCHFKQDRVIKDPRLDRDRLRDDFL